MLDTMNQITISKKTLPELIYQQIIDAIKSGKLCPNDLLPSEAEFAEQFHVGRTSVREAMAALEYLNVIVMQNGRYYVNENVQEFFQKKLLFHYGTGDKYRSDVFSVRRMFEIQYATLAAQRATRNDLKYMYEILSSVNAHLHSDKLSEENATRELQLLYIDFHYALASATHNSLLVLIFNRFKDLIFFVSDDFAVSLKKHQEIFQIAKKLVKQIDERDCIKAIETMKEYLDVIQPIYLRTEKE